MLIAEVSQISLNSLGDGETLPKLNFFVFASYDFESNIILQGVNFTIDFDPDDDEVQIKTRMKTAVAEYFEEDAGSILLM